MDNFKAIYRILKHLEASMDYQYTDMTPVSNTALNITYERWESLLIELQINGYIRGLVYTQSLSEGRAHITEPVQPVITIRGMEYLSENTLMQRVGRTLRGIKDALPGV